MVTDDVVIVDVEGQALDIFLHSPFCAQEWHRNGKLHTPKTKSKTLNSRNMTPSFSGPVPGGRLSRSLADAPQDCYTLEAFSLTENICRCVQRILQHFKTAIAFLTTSTITFSCLASAAP